jgi:hypothetical protein
MKVAVDHLVFWALVCGVMWALKLRPNSKVSRAAFTWFGPSPQIGESLSSFELRRLGYSFGWLSQFALVLSALLFLVSHYNTLREEDWFLLICFVLGMGIMLSLLATVGFLAMFLKARFVGPNPICESVAGAAS